MGKTALANEAVARAADRFALGSRRVDLTRVDDADAVPGALAAQLGFESFQALLDAPGDRKVLLLVDNCEHLLEAAARTIGRILEVCEQPTVLATSRSPLELPGESVVALAPFEVPTLGTPDPLAWPAVELFLERARDAGVRIDGADLDAVVDLCGRLDGLPLALEIAAARARTMSPAEIAERLRRAPTCSIGRGSAARHATAAWPRRSDGPTTSSARTNASCSSTSPCSPDRSMAAPPVGSRASITTTSASTPWSTSSCMPRWWSPTRPARRRATGCSRACGDSRWTGSRRAAGATPPSTASPIRRCSALARRCAARRPRGAPSSCATWCVPTTTSPRRCAGATATTPTRSGRGGCARRMWAVVHQGRADDVVMVGRQTIERWPFDGSSVAGAAVATLATAEYVSGEPDRAIALAEATLSALAAPSLAAVTLRRVLGQARRAVGDVPGALAAFRDGADMARQLDMPAMAVELDVAHAQVSADDGRVEEALPALRASVDESVRIGSVINEAWARSCLGWVRLRVDPASALEEIERRARDVAAHRLSDRRRGQPPITGVRRAPPRRRRRGARHHRRAPRRRARTRRHLTRPPRHRRGGGARPSDR